MACDSAEAKRNGIAPKKKRRHCAMPLEVPVSGATFPAEKWRRFLLRHLWLYIKK